MRLRKSLLFASIAVAAIVLGISAAVMGHADDNEAKAVLQNKDGNEVGTVQLNEENGNVEVSVKVHDLSAGFHGFHIHTVGKCDPPAFTSAGGHLGSLAGQTHPGHKGDLPVLLVNGDGTGQMRVTTDRFHVADLFDEDGSAVIVHALPDNYANIPVRYNATYNVHNPDATTKSTGDAGARVACGVILGSNSQDDMNRTLSTTMLQVVRTLFDSAKMVGRLTFVGNPL